VGLRGWMRQRVQWDASPMATTTVVHLLRHGEVHNPEKILYGRLPNFRLSELGEAMALRAAQALADHDITHIISSPLERAQQTAAPLAARFDLTVEIDERLIEADNVFEGKRVAVGDGVLRHPQYWPKLWNPFRPSWGEPYVVVAERMRAAIDSARDLARGHEVVLVSHQLPVWIARLSLENRRYWHDPRRRECSLASLTSATFSDDHLVAVTYTEPAADLLPGASPIAGA
jgi:broad specificity phosphatase PhoE